MPEYDNIRVDKWLWAARVYKTRSMAAEACHQGRITVNGTKAKPAYPIKPGTTLSINKPPVTYTYEVLTITDKRSSAEKASVMYKDITPQEESKKTNANFISFAQRDKGSGRPTKKERRLMDKLIN